MKKVWFLAVLGWIAAGAVSAEPLSFGVRLGGDMATQVSPIFGQGPSQTGDVIFGFTGGLFVETGLTDFLSLEPELDYVRKGLQENFNGIVATGPGPVISGTVNAKYTLTYDYLEIPILLKAHTSLSPHLIGSLSLGPEMGVFLGGNDHYSISSYGTGDAAVNAAGLEGGLLMGAGLELDRFLLDLRYDLGFTSTSPYPGGPTNSVLSLSLGYRVQ